MVKYLDGSEKKVVGLEVIADELGISVAAVHGLVKRSGVTKRAKINGVKHSRGGMTEVIIISAVAKNMVIGKDNDLPWHLPSDLKQFKTKTLGCPMVMGRKTWESFGSRPLPNRPHIVISSKLLTFDYPNVHHAFSLEEAIEKAKAFEKDVWVIGGQSIYEQALEVADRMYITHVDAEVDGDRYFPLIDPTAWKQVSQVRFRDDPIPFYVAEYVRARFMRK